MSAYEMKDLGYPRTPTTAQWVVTCPNGSVWHVPVQVIADSRDEHYAEDEEDTIGFIRAKRLDRYELNDWAFNSMNTEDLEDYATMVKPPDEPSWEDAWHDESSNHGIEGDL